MRATNRPRCSNCPGFLNRVGKTPNGSQKYRCSNCGGYDSDAKRRTAQRKQDRARQRNQIAVENAAVVQNLRYAGFITRYEMAERLGVSLTWVARLSRLGKMEEVRQHGRFGRYWVREPLQSLTLEGERE